MHDMHVWVCTLGCHDNCLILYHTHSESRASEPVAPPAAAAVLVVMKQSILARGGGWWWEKQTREHSVPAGDKGEACQRPHSSELTHTHTHTCKHSHHLSTLPSAFSLLSFTPQNPFPAFIVCFNPFVIALFSLHFSHLLYASYFSCLHIFCHSTLDEDECTFSQFRCIPNPLSIPAACHHTGKCTNAINNLSSLCKNVISSCRASCYESRMS